MAGRILIANDMVTHRIILKAWLGAAAYAVSQAGTGAEILSAARSGEVDLIVMVDNLPDQSGTEICRQLKANARTAAIPVILLSDSHTPARRLQALKAGADVVLDLLPDDALLRARIRNLMHRRAAEQELVRDSMESESYGLAEPAQAEFAACGLVTVIASSLAQGLRWRNGLAARLRDRIAVVDPDNALENLNGEPPPDVIVIAADPADPDRAMQLLCDLHSRSETFRTATVVVQPAPDPRQAVRALDMGASDLVDSGFDAAEMALLLRRELARKARNDTRRAALQDGLRLAATDPLTGLYNRRYALTQLDRITRNALENGENFAVMVLDLDRFKRINDQYGHAAGDAVLTESARRMNSCLRRDDFLARIGGEEFLAVIRNCDLAAAEIAAERLRRTISERPIDLPDAQGAETMTLSIGLVVGGTQEAPQDPAMLVSLADRGLYTAKAGGRNQVKLCQTAA
ncbi:MAG: diguanylate cyclase [Rhodobacter sp.]|nr:diguanylate cyclase [Rhodobacter sp.]